VECGCWEGVTRETLSTVLAVDGPVVLVSDHRESSPRAGDHAGRGSTVETKESSRVALALLPNCLVEVGPRTVVEIGRLGLTKDGDETGAGAMRERHSELKLKTGRVTVSHVWGQARALVRISTPQGEAVTPSNALFRVEAERDKTRVTCASGWIEFQPESGPAVQIAPGTAGEWTSSGSRIVSAETDPQAQETLQDALSTEGALRAQMAQVSNLIPR
jgi:hypothetical protein